MTDVLGNKKQWWESKTIWVNAILALVGIATYVTANYTPQSLQDLGISPALANEVLKASPLFVGIANIILRTIQSPTQIDGN